MKILSTLAIIGLMFASGCGTAVYDELRADGTRVHVGETHLWADPSISKVGFTTTQASGYLEGFSSKTTLTGADLANISAVVAQSVVKAATTRP